jgi:hypothetical protein
MKIQEDKKRKKLLQKTKKGVPLPSRRVVKILIYEKKVSNSV